jgi:metal-dependent amidase/aminoacylase/carboxypeptidase family protein
MLTPRDIAELTDWRRDLHRHPEVSRHEAATAARVVKVPELERAFLCTTTARIGGPSTTLPLSRHSRDY